jgi:3-keto-5-aminohexanoate cleavage enzyme
VRVGLEDYAGPRQPRNEELVAEIVDLARRCGRPLATPGEAAAMLGVA